MLTADITSYEPISDSKSAEFSLRSSPLSALSEGALTLPARIVVDSGQYTKHCIGCCWCFVHSYAADKCIGASIAGLIPAARSHLCWQLSKQRAIAPEICDTRYELRRSLNRR